MMTITMMTMTATRFFRQQPTLVGCIPGRGVVGDFHDDSKDEDDGNGDNNEVDHCPYHDDNNNNNDGNSFF
jgi:hypothetical protein